MTKKEWITERYNGSGWVKVKPGTLKDGQRYRLRWGKKLHMIGTYHEKMWTKSLINDSWMKSLWDKRAGKYGRYILEAKFPEAPDFIVEHQRAINGLDDPYTLFVSQKELEFLNRIAT